MLDVIARGPIKVAIVLAPLEQAPLVAQPVELLG